MPRILMPDLRNTAIEAARKAGALLLRRMGAPPRASVYGEGVYQAYEQDVSEADGLAHGLIADTILARFPAHGILGEDGTHNPGADFIWIVDALDGTTQYIAREPGFAVSIALRHRSQIILGAVYAPRLDELYVAEKGHGVELNGDPVAVSQLADPERAKIHSSAFGSYRIAGREEVFDALNRTFARIRITGAPALDLGYVARGGTHARISAYTKPWDHSAGCLIVEEAGGRVTEWDGSPWRPESEAFLASNGAIHESLLAFIQTGALPRQT